jgi:hypothetical protein
MEFWSAPAKFFSERFHERALGSLRQVRSALRYVLNNHRKHGVAARGDLPDAFSSGRYFDGWTELKREFDPGANGSFVAVPGWKLGVRWRRAGEMIGVAAVPG